MAENHYDLDYTGSMVDRILDTGYDLQNQGYIFRGLASHYTGTPTERTWLIAPTGSTGFGLSSPVPPGSIGICMYNGSSWSAEVLNTLTLDTAPTDGSGNGITSGAVKTLAESITNAIGQLEQSVSDRFTSMELEDTTGSLQAEVLSITLKYVFEGEEETLTSLSILAATAEKAGLMSAADKQKLDAFITNIRSLRIQETTAQADQDAEITNTLKWTIGGVTEAITAFTLYAATTSKAGLMSAADKTALDTLPSLINAGYLYAGIATPSTVPSSTSAKIFYIAIEGGTYTSFGNLNVTQGINIIYKSGNAWSVAQAVGIDDKPTLESKNLVESSGIAKALIDIKGVLEYSTTISVDSGISYIEFPVNIQSGRTVYIDFNTLAEVETCRIYANEVETEKLIPYGGSISVKNLVFTPSFNVNKIVVYLSNTTVGGDFEAVIRFSDSLEDAKGGINNIEKFISQSNQDLTGIVYTPFKSIDASNGNLTEDTKSFVCDYIAIDPSVSSIVYWNWGKINGATPGEFVFALYDESKAFLKTYTSSANATDRGINLNNDQDARYIRASFSVENIYNVYLHDYYKDTYLFKLDKDGEQNVVESIKKLGVSLDGSLDFSDVVGVKCVKVENIDIKAGTKVNVQVKTDKVFTRFMVGFNAAYAQAVNLYKNFYNSDTIDYTLVAEVDLTSLWLYLVSAENTDIVADYTILTGAYLQNDDITVDSDIVVMPTNTYILSDVENSIYHSNYLKYVSDKFLVSQGGTGWRFLQRCFRVNRQNNVALSIIIRDREKLSPLKTFNTQTIVGSKAIDVAKKVNAIGDSYTYNGYWYQHIANLVDGLSFVGMRKSYGCEEPLRGEGRGGWTLANYFQPHNSVVPTSMQPFSPFMHVSGYTYYGVIDFWKVIVNGTSQYTYGTAGFDDYKDWFDTDGYKVNPETNALMYDGINDKYVYYNGSAWLDFDGTPEFVFDYAKYISTWNIASPDIVAVMLGKNDFQNSSTEADYAAWKEKMDTLIASVQDYAESASKTIYIGICTPTTANQAPNNSPNYVVPEIGGRNMWNARKYIIENYDKDSYREEGVYVVDSGICLDPDYGFPLRADKPFEWYEGDEKELISINGVHPSNGGYAQIGTCVGGWIQYIRSL